jgi:DNA primase
MLIKEIVKRLGIKVSRENGYSHELYCWCPFHDDTVPSFNINYVTGKWQCHAARCGAKGHSINDLSRELIGKEFNVEDETDNWVERIHKNLYPEIKIDSIPSIPVIPMALFNQGQKFLNDRGIDNLSIKKWNLMYWPREDAVVIPIEFNGYILRYLHPKTAKEKYKYVPGTRITASLFGEEYLTIGEKYGIILVEGSLDAIALHQKGFKNTVSLLHADISDAQIKLLMKYMCPVYVMLDPDDGGTKASKVVYNKLREHFTVRICELPEGKDPDVCTVDEINKSLQEARLGGLV